MQRGTTDKGGAAALQHSGFEGAGPCDWCDKVTGGWCHGCDTRHRLTMGLLPGAALPAQAAAPPPAPICSDCATGELDGLCRGCADVYRGSDDEADDGSDDEVGGSSPTAAHGAPAESPPCLPLPATVGPVPNGDDLRRQRISCTDARAAFIVRTNDLLIAFPDGAPCNQCGSPTKLRCGACIALGRPAPPSSQYAEEGGPCPSARALPLCRDCGADNGVAACRRCNGTGSPAHHPPHSGPRPGDSEAQAVRRSGAAACVQGYRAYEGRTGHGQPRPGRRRRGEPLHVAAVHQRHRGPAQGQD